LGSVGEKLLIITTPPVFDFQDFLEKIKKGSGYLEK
jgi:hypothetical protein